MEGSTWCRDWAWDLEEDCPIEYTLKAAISLSHRSNESICLTSPCACGTLTRNSLGKCSVVVCVRQRWTRYLEATLAEYSCAGIRQSRSPSNRHDPEVSPETQAADRPPGRPWSAIGKWRHRPCSRCRASLAMASRTAHHSERTHCTRDDW